MSHMTMSTSNSSPVGTTLFSGALVAQRLETASQSSDSAVQQLKSALTELYLAVQGRFPDDTGPVVGSVYRAAAVLGLSVAPVDNASAHSQQQPKEFQAFRGGPASWQVRNVKAHIEANLDADICIADLAKLARLSRCHFSRMFRRSFDCSPHAYVLRRRVVRAQRMMLETSESLVGIANICGFCDQPHFTRQFNKFVGVSPGAWRRANAATHL
jgi:AraC family transcriptional regulator